MLEHSQVKNPIVVSLTSHPPRFAYLEKQLSRLSIQTRLPDLLVLNIAEKDYEYLPLKIRSLNLPFSFEINICEDLGPGLKLIPTLIKYKSSTIITIDDDIDYDNSLIECLVEQSEAHAGDIIAARAHRPKFYSGKPIRYAYWDLAIEEDLHHILMPTGVGGVLYPPYSLDSDVTNMQDYENLSYSTDDLWFWVHSIRKGTRVRTMKKSLPLVELKSAQLSGLSVNGNIEFMNDVNLGLLWVTYNMKEILRNHAEKSSLVIFETDKINEVRNKSDINGLDQSIDRIVELLLAVEPKKRLEFIKFLMSKDAEIRMLLKSQETLRTSFIFVCRNLLRKIKAKNFNG
jgi:hypothetical protein